MTEELTVRLELRPRRIVAGKRALGRVLVSNSSPRPISPRVLFLPVGVAEATFSIPELAPGAEHEELFAVPTHRRAVIPVGPVYSTLNRGDVALRPATPLTAKDELIVHPKTALLSGLSTERAGLVGGVRAARFDQDTFDFSELVEYSPGSDLRALHWSTSARAGVLMLKRYTTTSPVRQLAILRTDGDEYASEEEFDLAVSVAASIGLRSIRERVPFDLVSDEESLPAGSPTDLLDALAGIVTSHSAPHVLGEAVSMAVRRAGSPNLVALFTGSTLEFAQLAPLRRLLPRDIDLIIVRCELGATPGLERVGGARILTVGALDHLADALRKAGY
ncbi:MAG: DUF58 domain-containing protein [Actinomycetota bacterium]